jgi:hypothetical protein
MKPSAPQRRKSRHPPSRAEGINANAKKHWTWVAVALMFALVLAIYIPVRTSATDNALVGLDYFELHLFRIRFAQQTLFSPSPHLPGWYPRELMGTPFWSNIQDFPFLPTRLLMLAWDPLLIYPIAVNLAALLAALFTFLYARRIGLSRVGAALAGWTFAAAGFYASRVMAGHLPLLEAYPALPLLLWLVERCRSSAGADRKKVNTSLLAIGIVSGCVALAGHPQIPIYALGAAILYASYRVGGRFGARIVAAIVLGAGTAAFALWPMWLLIRRSTRVLALDPPSNDIAFPYRRLIAFILPWSQGWAGAVPRFPHVAVAYPGDAYFWETVCYVGLLPLAAALFLLVRAIVTRRSPDRPGRFIVFLSVAGLLLAFPAARLPFAHLTGTFLRSPARLLYFTAFGLALGLAAATDVLIASSIRRRAWWAVALVALGCGIHLFDLGSHDRQFIRMVTYNKTLRESELQLARGVGAGRVAIDSGLWTPLNRELDDVGYFDSIALAKPYAAILDLAGLPVRLNTQYIDGSDLNRRTLAACGVVFVATNKSKGGQAQPGAPINVYGIPHPAPRAEFFPTERVVQLDQAEIHRRLRDPDFDVSRTLMLPKAAALSMNPATQPATAAPEIMYVRDSEDQITLTIHTSSSGVLRVLESWDPGWTATVDERPATILPADDAFLSVAIPPGLHTAQFKFKTPGATAGGIISTISLLCLIAVCLNVKRAKT